ncbi:MAG: hypothetical protein LC135_10260 [Phycisphaerae bacterium]|nr:hypothetical protein [Phycisphaerae bacterium]
MCCCSGKNVVRGLAFAALVGLTVSAYAAQVVDTGTKAPSALSFGTERGEKVAFHSWTDVGGVMTAPPPNDECTGAITINCGSTTTVNNTEATDNFGSDPGFSCFWDGSGSQGNGTMWYRFQATDARARIITCSTASPVDDTISAIYSGSCGSLVEIGCGEDGCGVYHHDYYANVTSGTFYIIQMSTNDGYSARGNITMELQCLPALGPVCTGNEDIKENVEEPACGLPVDTTNGGCNSVPNVFRAAACGQTICGSAFSDGATRDTDWFDYGGVAVETLYTWEGQADFPNQPLIVLDAAGNCGSLSIVAGAFFAPGPFTLSACVPATPGAKVYGWEGGQFTVFPCGSLYGVKMTCGPCNPIPPACQGDENVIEDEANCGLPADSVNGGCNSIPEVYGSLNCGDKICGTYAFDGALRDTDWFKFSTSATGDITWTVTGQDAFQGLIIADGDGNPNNFDCATLAVIAFAQPPAGVPGASFVAAAPADGYVAWAGPQFAGLPPCGREYRGVLECTGGGGGCAGDINGDGCVGQADLGILLANFNQSVPPNTNGDLNGDGFVGQVDLGILLGNWGCGCP